MRCQAARNRGPPSNSHKAPVACKCFPTILWAPLQPSAPDALFALALQVRAVRLALRAWRVQQLQEQRTAAKGDSGTLVSEDGGGTSDAAAPWRLHFVNVSSAKAAQLVVEAQATLFHTIAAPLLSAYSQPHDCANVPSSSSPNLPSMLSDAGMLSVLHPLLGLRACRSRCRPTFFTSARVT